MKPLMVFFIICLLNIVTAQILNLGKLFGSDKLSDIFTSNKETESRSSSNILDAWLTHMKNFDSNHMLAFEIGAGETKVFYIDITKTPQSLRGAYTVSAKATNKITFSIIDPEKDVILLKQGEKEVIFYPNVTVAGKYSLEFKNGNVSRDVSKQIFGAEEILFGAAPDYLEKEKPKLNLTLNAKTLTEAEGKLKVVETNVNDITTQQRFFGRRKSIQKEGTFLLKLIDVASIGWKSLYITIGETMIVIALTIWEVYYIKKMLDFRQIV